MFVEIMDGVFTIFQGKVHREGIWCFSLVEEKEREVPFWANFDHEILVLVGHSIEE